MLERLTFPLLEGVNHGFFTRRGGASSGLYAGLNCGRGSSDQRSAVDTNRARVAAEMGVGADRLLTLYQVHSADVVTVDAQTDPAALRERRADAMVTATAGFALSILTADCQPVLLADRAAGVVGAAHGGWRGTLAGVLEATVAAMRDLGARRIRAVVGPAIAQPSYEVGPEMEAQFIAADPSLARFFRDGPNGRPLFDLPGLGVARLRAAGVEAEWCGLDTCADAARFFSYRRATRRGEPDYGRQISVITL